MWNAGLDEAKAGIKIAGRSINNLRYADDTILMAESEEQLKSLFMKEESEKAGLKLRIQKMKIMTSGPITWWQIDGETMETVTDFIFWDSKITADGNCSHEIKSHLLLGRKAMTNLDSILKRRGIPLPTKVCLVKTMDFLVVMYGWTIWELDHKESLVPKVQTFELRCWRRLESPMDCKEFTPVDPKGNQSWVFIERTDAEAPILWLPDAEKDWRWKEKGTTEDEMVGWHHQLDGHEFEQAPGDGEAWRAAVHGVTKSWTRLNNWTDSLIDWNCHGASGYVVLLADWGSRSSPSWLVCHLGPIWF